MLLAPVAVLAALALAGAGVDAQFRDPNCDGKQVIVHLFEWRYSSIARECEEFLGPMGFCGVQVRPFRMFNLKFSLCLATSYVSRTNDETSDLCYG